MLKVLESNNQYFSKKDIDLVRLYVQETKKYPLLTREEEQKYGKHLQLYPEIMDILSVAKINNNVETVLNLDKILASITIEEEREYITNILTSYYNNYGNQESKSDKIMMYYLQEYNKLCKTLHHIPTPEELTSYFSNQSKEKIFTNFTNTPRLESKDLILKVSNYVRYMIAKNTMINCNLRLVIGVAKKYNITDSMELLDRINEGNKGLMTAVEKFDVDKGYKFSTYAMWWITQKITRGIVDTDKMIRIPVAADDKRRNYNKKRNKLEQESKRELTEKEISKKLNIPLEQVIDYRRIDYLSRNISIETPVGENKDTLLLELISNDIDIENDITKIMLQEEINKVLSYLTNREREVIELRFGLKDGIVHTLEETGKQYNVTRERIRQIEATALKKLRNPRRSRKLKDFYEDNN